MNLASDGKGTPMVHKTVLKVDIACQKCKRKLLKAVSGLQGVDKIEVDPTKNTLTVTGDADPIKIIVRIRKTGNFAEVVSIGPPQPPPKPASGGGGGGGGGGQKKGDDKKGQEQQKSEQKAQVHLPQTCYVCEQMNARLGPYDTQMSCTIM